MSAAQVGGGLSEPPAHLCDEELVSAYEAARTSLLAARDAERAARRAAQVARRERAAYERLLLDRAHDGGIPGLEV